MASPLKPGKQAVDLAGKGAPRVSRIRRDPPPKVKEVTVAELEERDARTVAIGVTAFAIAIAAIILGLASYGGWTPAQHKIELVSRS
jgi:hypothetical protein